MQSSEELSQLIALHKKTKNRRDADKLKCIIYHGNGWTWDEIKEALFITDGTIKFYLDHYEKGGVEELLKKRHKGHHFKLSPEQEKIVACYVESHNILCSKQVCDYAKRKFGVRYSPNGMTLLLKRLGFSYKKPKLRPPVVNSLSQLVFIWNYYWKILTQKEDESLYFLDAAGFQHNTRLDYGWMKKGEEKELPSNSGRKKINVNGVYNPKTHDVITVNQETNINTDSNIALIEKVIRSDLGKRKITFILDNARMNHSKKLKEFISTQDIEIVLWHLPTYSPNLNLIERLWRYSKKKLLSNKYYSSYMDFKSDLDKFFATKIHKMERELKILMFPNFQIFKS